MISQPCSARCRVTTGTIDTVTLYGYLQLRSPADVDCCVDGQPSCRMPPPSSPLSPSPPPPAPAPFTSNGEPRAAAIACTAAAQPTALTLPTAAPAATPAASSPPALAAPSALRWQPVPQHDSHVRRPGDSAAAMLHNREAVAGQPGSSGGPVPSGLHCGARRRQRAPERQL